MARGRSNGDADRYITATLLKDGRTSYAITVRKYWHDGRVLSRYVDTVYDDPEGARRLRDEALAKMRAENEAARNGGESATDDTAGDTTQAAPLPEPEPGSSLWAQYERLQRVIWEQETETCEAALSIETDQPILLPFTSDWHVGSQHCRMERLRLDLDAVARANGAVRLFLGGDLFSFALPNSVGGQFEELARPKLQRQMVDELIEPVTEYVASICSGNHDARAANVADFDAVGYLAERIQKPYFGPFGMLHLTVGGYEYHILGAHSFRMRSSFNKTHQAKRLMDFVGDADAVFTGHTHDAAGETTEVRQRARFFGQAASYQIPGGYARSLGFTAGSPKMPGVLLFPAERRVIGTWDAFGDGLHLLASYRRDYECRCRYCLAKRN